MPNRSFLPLGRLRRATKVQRIRSSSIRSHVGRVYFNAHRLTDQIHRQDETRTCALSNESANDTPQRSVDDLDHHALADHRAWIIGKFTVYQRADTFDFVLGNWG